jgi:hypothetical protein
MNIAVCASKKENLLPKQEIFTYFFSVLPQWPQEAHPPEQWPEQVLLSGQPMHFCPLFLAFTI